MMPVADLEGTGVVSGIAIGGRLKLCTGGMRRSVDGLRKIEESRIPLRSGVASHNDNGT